MEDNASKSDVYVFNLAISFLWVYSANILSYVQNDSYAKLLIVAVFVIGNDWTELKFQLIKE